MIMATSRLICFVFSTALIAAESKFAGSNACKSCHPVQYRTQSATGHAHALSRATASLLPDKSLRRSPAYEFQFTREAHARVSDAKDMMDIPIEWAFGAGDQAVTFVSRIDRDWYLEHYFTFYRATGTLAATPGQHSIVPKSLPEAAGLVYKALDREEGIVRCFECHSTGPVDTAGSAVLPAEPGVHCEACHGPGAEHARDGRAAMMNPRRLSAAALNDFCGKCHRPPAARDTRIDWKLCLERPPPAGLPEPERLFSQKRGQTVMPDVPQSA
jgi:hypothetical protein